MKKVEFFQNITSAENYKITLPIQHQKNAIIRRNHIPRMSGYILEWWDDTPIVKDHHVPEVVIITDPQPMWSPCCSTPEP